MKHILPLLLLSIALIVSGCGDSNSGTDENSCTPACDDTWQVCNNGSCEAKAGYCSSSVPCNNPDKPHCDLDTNTCSTVTTDCNGSCGEWQYCYYGACKTRPDRCIDHGDCTAASKPVCDPDSHFCVAQTSRCNPACQDWEVCNETTFTCELGPGNCNKDTECTISGLPICDLTTHECKGETSDCEGGCGDWGYCYNGFCQVKQDGLHCGEGVPCISIHLPHCNEITHQCEVDPGDVCEPACDFWQSCESGTCVTAYGYCGTGRPCEDPQRPICNSETHLCEAQVQNTYVDPITIDQFPGLIVTTNSMKSSFQKIADLHTLTGLPTQVKTIDELGGNIDGIRDYLKANQAEVKYLLIGGDIEDIPSKRVNDSYSQPLFNYSYNETFYTDLYFGELSNWGTNGDPSNFDPEIAVGRVPASSSSEVNTYFDKVKRYLTEYPSTKIKKGLIFSNVALSYDIAGYTSDFDSAIYMEYSGRTVDILEGGDIRLAKLYHSANNHDGAEEINVPFQQTEMNKSPNFIVHMGHGSVDSLTSELDGSVAFTEADLNDGDLNNNGLSIFISGACDAGKFEASDSIGEKLIMKETQGAIAYIGNTTVGLGIAGGSQFIDEFLRDAVTGGGKTVGSAFVAAHKNLPTSDTPDFLPSILQSFVQLIDTNSYRWTQKSTVLLGDPMLPIYNSSRSQPAQLTITKAALSEGTQITIAPVDPTKRITGTVLLLTSNGNYYRFEGGSQRKIQFKIKEDPAKITYGLYGDAIFSLWEEITFK